MKNLAELKHYLTLPKAALRMLSLEWFVNGEWKQIELKPELKQYRFVAKVQTNAAQLITGNRLSRFDFGKASEWCFDSSTNTITNITQGHRISYVWANLAIVEDTEEWNRLEALEGAK